MENLPAKTKNNTTPITAPPMTTKTIRGISILTQRGPAFAGVTLYEKEHVKEAYSKYWRTLTQAMKQWVSIVCSVEHPDCCWDGPYSVWNLL